MPEDLLVEGRGESSQPPVSVWARVLLLRCRSTRSLEFTRGFRQRGLRLGLGNKVPPQILVPSQVSPLDDIVETADIFVTTTGNKDIIMASDMAKMKNNAIVGNIGHFDNEIDMAGLLGWQGIKRQNIKPQVLLSHFQHAFDRCHHQHCVLATRLRRSVASSSSLAVHSCHLQHPGPLPWANARLRMLQGISDTGSGCEP